MWREISLPDGENCLDILPSTQFDIRQSDRIQYYSGFVRAFHWWGYNNMLNESVSHFLSRLPAPYMLFPNLQFLRLCEDTAPKNLPIIKRLLGPQISSLWMMSSRLDDLSSVLAAVGDQCPVLEHLTFPKFTATPPAALARLLTRPGHLMLRTYNSSAHLPRTGVLALAKMPSLQLVYLRSRAADLANMAFPNPSFPSLKKLRWTVDKLSHSTSNLIRAIHSSSWQEVTVVTYTTPRPSILAEHLKVLTKHPLTTLEIIVEDDPERFAYDSEYEDGFGTPHDPTAPYVPAATLLPLRSAPTLETLRIYVPNLSLNYDTIAAAARAFPRLKSLNLHGSRAQEIAPISALLPLVQECPGLVHISLHVDAQTAPPLPPASFQPRAQVKYLYLTLSPITSSASPGISAYLKNLFPSLLHLGCYCHEDEGMRLCHEVVAQLGFR